MNAPEFERRLRALARRDGMTFSSFATLGDPDRAVLVDTIVRRFDPDAVYSERDVNRILKQWLAGAGAMVETDHVNVRRWLVDTQVLARTPDCAEYRLCPESHALLGGEDAAAIRKIDADRLVAGTREEARAKRAQRKAAWLARGSAEGGAPTHSSDGGGRNDRSGR